jgi:hypothetical protein
MPVVINEFEVVAEVPEQRTPSAPRGASGQAAPPPPDVDAVLADRRAREQRVRAY